VLFADTLLGFFSGGFADLDSTGFLFFLYLFPLLSFQISLDASKNLL
jgi:hypothetical protein